MRAQAPRQGVSPAALAWLGLLLLLLAGSLVLVVYAGRGTWREIASQRSVRNATTPAEGKPAAATGRPTARPVGPKAAAPSPGRRDTRARPGAGAKQTAGRPPVEAAASARPRPAPKRISPAEAARRLEALGAKLDRDHFQFAVAGGEIDQVRVFLEAGYSPNLKMQSADHSIFYLTLIGLADPKQEAVATLMLDYGADLEVRAPSGITPLMMAAIHCKPRFAEALIDGGAQVNATDPEGTTALVWAQRASCAPVAALLGRRGAR